MLRYETKTRPGLVALYDIRPGNGAGPFLQPRSPHGAIACSDNHHMTLSVSTISVALRSVLEIYLNVLLCYFIKVHSNFQENNTLPKLS